MEAIDNSESLSLGNILVEEILFLNTMWLYFMMSRYK